MLRKNIDMMQRVCVTVVLVLACWMLTTPCIVAQDPTGWKEAFASWSTSMNRGFRNLFTPPPPISPPTISSPTSAIPTTSVVPPPSVMPPEAFPGNGAGLTADVLKKTLIAKTPAEAAYIDEIIARRDRGKIAAQTVSSAYRYAMKKQRDRRVQYFKAAIDAMTGG